MVFLKFIETLLITTANFVPIDYSTIADGFNINLNSKSLQFQLVIEANLDLILKINGKAFVSIHDIFMIPSIKLETLSIQNDALKIVSVQNFEEMLAGSGFIFTADTMTTSEFFAIEMSTLLNPFIFNLMALSNSNQQEFAAWAFVYHLASAAAYMLAGDLAVIDSPLAITSLIVELAGLILAKKAGYTNAPDFLNIGWQVGLPILTWGVGMIITIIAKGVAEIGGTVGFGAIWAAYSSIKEYKYFLYHLAFVILVHTIEAILFFALSGGNVPK